MLIILRCRVQRQPESYRTRVTTPHPCGESRDANSWLFPSTMADVLAMADIHTAPVVNSGFNVSYLTTNVYEWTKRFMTLPGRVMERIHLLEELLQEDPYQQAEAIATAAREGRTDVPFRRSAIRMSGTTLPGPWGFFVSGYAVVVVILVRDYLGAHSITDMNMYRCSC
jgi:hypothetical protein